MPVYKQGPTGNVNMRLTRREARAYNRVVDAKKTQDPTKANEKDLHTYTFVSLLFREYIKMSNASVTPEQMADYLVET